MSKVTLSAEMGWYYDHTVPNPSLIVRVCFGNTEIAVLEPVRESKAGHGDDSSYFLSEEQNIVEETVAPYLRRLFDAAA